MGKIFFSFVSVAILSIPLLASAKDAGMYAGFTQGRLWVKDPGPRGREQKYAAMESLNFTRSVENGTHFSELSLGYCFNKFFCAEFGHIDTGDVRVTDVATSKRHPNLSAQFEMSARATANRYSLITKFPINEYIVPQIKAGVMKYVITEEAKLYPSTTLSIDNVQGIALYKEQTERGSVFVGSVGVGVNYKGFGMVADYAKTSKGGIFSWSLMAKLTF